MRWEVRKASQEWEVDYDREERGSMGWVIER